MSSINLIIDLCLPKVKYYFSPTRNFSTTWLKGGVNFTCPLQTR
nr:MAG TPA: hypothetical protein [Caudoviricetes sp.]